MVQAIPARALIEALQLGAIARTLLLWRLGVLNHGECGLDNESIGLPYQMSE